MNTSPLRCLLIALLPIALSALMLIGCDRADAPSESLRTQPTQAQPADQAADQADTPTDTPADPPATNDPKEPDTPTPTPTYDHSDSDEDQATYLRQSFSEAATKDLDLLPMIRKLHDQEIPLIHQQIIYTILAHTNESAIHQMRGETDNKVYIHEDGREGVYDKAGNLVTNGYNDGTFNYANPKTEPLLHYTMDISPWIQLGISETDPTSTIERIYAYMGDLEAGIVRAHQSLPIEPLDENHRWSGTGQLQALAIFLKAIEAGHADELFELFDSPTAPTDRQLISVLRKLNRGFNIVYGAAGP